MWPKHKTPQSLYLGLCGVVFYAFLQFFGSFSADYNSFFAVKYN